MSKYEVIIKIIESIRIKENDKVWYIEMFLKGYLTEEQMEWLWKE